MLKLILLILLTTITYPVVLSAPLAIFCFMAMTVTLNSSTSISVMTPTELFYWWKEQFVKLAGAIDWLKNESN